MEKKITPPSINQSSPIEHNTALPLVLPSGTDHPPVSPIPQSNPSPPAFRPPPPPPRTMVPPTSTPHTPQQPQSQPQAASPPPLPSPSTSLVPLTASLPEKPSVLPLQNGPTTPDWDQMLDRLSIRLESQMAARLDSLAHSLQRDLQAQIDSRMPTTLSTPPFGLAALPSQPLLLSLPAPDPGPPTTNGLVSPTLTPVPTDQMDTTGDDAPATTSLPPRADNPLRNPPPGSGPNWHRNQARRELRRQRAAPAHAPSPPPPLVASIANLSLGDRPGQTTTPGDSPPVVTPPPPIRRSRPALSASLPRPLLAPSATLRRAGDPPPSPAVLAYLASIAAADPKDPTAQLSAILHPKAEPPPPAQTTLAAPQPVADDLQPLHLYRLSQPSLPDFLADHPPSLVDTWNAIFQSSTRLHGAQLNHLGIYPLLHPSRDVEILIHPRDASAFCQAMSAFLVPPTACLLSSDDIPRRLQLYFRRITKSVRLAAFTGMPRPLVLQLLQTAARSPRTGFASSIQWDLTHISLVPFPPSHHPAAPSSSPPMTTPTSPPPPAVPQAPPDSY